MGEKREKVRTNEPGERKGKQRKAKLRRKKDDVQNSDCP